MLPKAANNEKTNKQFVSISITEDKRYFIDKKEVPFEELEATLLAEIGENTDQSVIVRIPFDSQIQELVDVLQIGVKNNLKFVIATQANWGYFDFCKIKKGYRTLCLYTNKTYNPLYQVLHKDSIELYIVPHLPLLKRGFKSKAPLYEIVNAILYKLKTSVQWIYLPVQALFSAQVLSHKTVFGHFRNWYKVGVWQSCWIELLKNNRSLCRLK